MKITDLIKKEGINLAFKADSKEEAINQLVDLMAKTGNLKDKEAYKQGILAREAQSTTGIGEGIAIPHAKNKGVQNPGLAVARAVDGVEFESLDDQKAKLFFMIAAPENGANVHLDMLSRLSVLLMDESFLEELLQAKSKEDFLACIDRKEKEKFPEEVEAPKASSLAVSKGYQVLAVTACPTGIAHTYMAAESLQNKAEDKGISLKVETNGSTGAKNILTKADIEHATCIIVAADKKVDMARFEGKKVIQTKVANGIHKADELLERAAKGDAPVYHHSGGADESSASGEKESFGRQIYKHLMNGVSHMLPFVIGGGLLIALAFLFDDYSINPSNFGSNTPFAAFLKSVGDAAFGFMLPVLAGYIAMSIGERPALAVGFVGGLLANTGGAGFLGALLAGFIAGYLVKALSKVFSYLPQSLEGIKPTLLYPLFGTLLIGAIMTFVVNPPVAAANMGLTNFLNSMGTTSQVMLGIVVAAMMAIDMGGPINKAAYVFGVASLESGNFAIMAAVMAGGMVPPLAIAIATTIFRNKFTKKDKEAGLTNYIMGLSFITEGAIPFAAADPLRVIPAAVVGSAVAGGLTMAFDCALRAPHGGIFVLPVIQNPLGYAAAVVIGAVVGAIILGMLKKTINQ
ncbi:MAG: PTS fructose transporter subunit IIABC [Cellulosilyticaceae bacterium]